MTEVTSKNIDENKVVRKLTWNTGDIFQANFMFPTEHFKESSDLENMTMEEYTKFLSNILEPCLPLSVEEKKTITESVHSSSRLRVYYHTLAIIDRNVNVVNETSNIDLIEESLDETMAHLVSKSGKVTIVGKDIPDALDSWQEKHTENDEYLEKHSEFDRL